MAEEGSRGVPLLQPAPAKDKPSSYSQVLGNIIVSIVGTGVLGLPYAFKNAGWLAGSAGVILAGISTYYCMLLLVQCRKKMETVESMEIITYGDVGAISFGRPGRYVTETLVLIAQCGGAVAYLVFIGQNLSSIFKHSDLSFSSFIFMLVPVEIALSWIRSLSSLAPFSVFADICNVLAMGIVVKEDLQLFEGFSQVKAVTGIGALPFVGGVALFCYEGFSMTLALEASMEERSRFGRVLAHAFLGITTVYVCFGFLGYLAYGEQTMDIITLNLPNDWSATAVKVGLCVGLTFTFPIMMHPMHEIMATKLTCFGKPCHDDDSRTGMERMVLFYGLRSLAVMLVAFIASFIPGFGLFISLVGSTVCALLSFVLPASFHLKLLGPSLSFWTKALDYVFLIFGLVFAGYGTYATVSSAS